ncbi:MAG TPA: type II toxin-antitoxin system Phd/YefM family antitoxin [Candidatus Baltobacteraceae bacterium]|nr:type II toxin-antitoxin system Phd/YefM family antitoxin [Candidatus Baltobacteraceae bacterium]
MSITPKDVIPLTKARARLPELCEEVSRGGTEKLITRNGESCAVLIGVERLEYFHRLERERIHLTLLDEAVRGLEDVKAERTVSLRKLRSRHGR